MENRGPGGGRSDPIQLPWYLAELVELAPDNQCILNYIKTWGVDEGKKGTWADVTAAGDTLKVEGPKAGKFVITSKTRGEIPAVSHDVRRIRTDMLTNLIEDITVEDVTNFNAYLKAAEQEIQLYNKYLTYDANLIQHDSSLESVIEKLPMNEYSLCTRVTIESIIKMYIKEARSWYEQDLLNKFILFLSDCSYLETMLADHIPFESCYQKLKDDPRFVEMSSSYVQPLILKRELQTYLFHLRAMCQLPDEEKKVAISEYQSIVRARKQSEMLLYQEMRKSFPTQFMTPFHFLVQRRSSEGYEFRDPVIEIVKARFYFGIFTAGVWPWISEDCTSCREPKQNRKRKRKR